MENPSEDDDDTVYVWVNFGMASLYVLKVLSSAMDSAEIRNLSQEGERSDFSENHLASLSLKTTYRMSLILAGSISLDSTFNLLLFSWKILKKHETGSGQADLDCLYTF